MKEKRVKKAWPTQQAMQQVYALKLWGNNGSVFYSGEGSHVDEILQPYIKAVSSFLLNFQGKISVCDLGCGDFNVGEKLLKYTSNYIAIDIVPELIKYNKGRFVYDNLEFLTLDISDSKLPDADCVIIRQVLQHLSNAEIVKITKEIKKYMYVILTEHLPYGSFKANLDIISGQGIRLKKKSGVDISKAPFNFKFKSSKVLTEVELGNNKGLIRTVVYTN